MVELSAIEKGYVMSILVIVQNRAHKIYNGYSLTIDLCDFVTCS